MTFKTKKVKTQTLGEYLGECRKGQGLPLSEIAQISQIQVKYLSALEEGRFADLPAVVYVKGFLRTLAKIYKIEERVLLEQFSAEQEISQNLEVEINKKPQFNFPRFVFSPRTLTILGLSVLGVLSLSYLYFQVSSLSRPPRLQIFSPEKDGVVSSSLLVVRGKTEAGSVVYLNNQPLVTNANGEFRENLSLGPNANQLILKAINKFGREIVITRSITLREKEIAGSSTINFVGQESLKLEIMIHPNAAWIYLEADEVEKYAGTMLPNAKQTITAKEKIVLTTGNAGSTRIFLNGKDLGILGKEGEVIRDLEFTK